MQGIDQDRGWLLVIIYTFFYQQAIPPGLGTRAIRKCEPRIIIDLAKRLHRNAHIYFNA